MRKKTVEPSLLKLLISGNVRKAKLLLGSLYTISGKVIHGNHLGRKIGFPTANLEIDNNCYVLPAPGVYAVLTQIEEHEYPAMANIGYRPTFNGTVLTIEVHIFDFQQDIYEKIVKVSFVDRIRDEIKFPKVNLLIDQLNQDRKIAKELIVRWSNPDSDTTNAFGQ